MTTDTRFTPGRVANEAALRRDLQDLVTQVRALAAAIAAIEARLSALENP